MSFRFRFAFVVAAGCSVFVHCSSFHSDDGDGVDAGGAEASGADAGGAEASGADTGADAGSDALATRTALSCGDSNVLCQLGEECCYSMVDRNARCAASCEHIEGGAYTFECGKPSDCAPSNQQECCFSNSDACGSQGVSGSRCVARGNCNDCTREAGPYTLGCDKTRNDECPANTQCSVMLFGSYAGCGLQAGH